MAAGLSEEAATVEARRRHEPAFRRLWSVLWPPAVVGVLLLASWQLLSVWGPINRTFLPGPVDVAQALVARWAFLQANIWQTVWQTLVGLVLSVIVGVALGMLLGSWPWFRRAIYPFLVMLQILPKVALAPLFILWLGIDAPSRLLMVFTLSFFPCMINSSLGLSSVDPDFVRMAHAFGGGRRDTFLRVKLPAALPAIFSGIKIAVTLAVIGIVVAEFVAAQTGLGYVIIFAQGRLDTALVFATLFLLSAFGLVLYGLVALVERLVIFWQPAATAESSR